jgi:hypothetical protein
MLGSTARTSISATKGSIRATVPGLAAPRSQRAIAARISSFQGMSGQQLRGDGEEPPLAGHALQLVSATLLELEPRSNHQVAQRA